MREWEGSVRRVSRGGRVMRRRVGIVDGEGLGEDVERRMCVEQLYRFEELA